MFHELYEPVIGLEVHAQLLTESKAFSPDSAAFGAEPNHHVDPVSLGHPGTLPVLNRKVVDFAVLMGLATHCSIAPRSVLARKHYFYPDLPKGYQISQFETPICSGGYIEILPDEQASVRRIGLTRIHIEEDAGKLIHDQDPYNSHVDFNRCGVPLIEIVSEPDIRSPREAYLFMQKIRQIVRYLGICDGNMEEGSLRCDANVSVRRRGERRFGTKTEIKNLNSFRFVEKALEYEIFRQIALLENGDSIVQETRLWDTSRMETRSTRSKEEAHDYRYFPDPDLVQVVVTNEAIEQKRVELPELPDARQERLVRHLGLPAYDAALLTEDRLVADYFDAVFGALSAEAPSVESGVRAKAVSNILMTEVLRVLNERAPTAGAIPIDPVRLAGLLRMRLADEISSSAATVIFNAMLDDPEGPAELAKRLNLLQVSDTVALVPVIDRVIADNPAQVEQYRNGKQSVIGFFIGQVMKNFSGSPDPRIVRQLLAERLDSV